MQPAPASPAAPAPAVKPQAPPLASTVLRVAWLSILLGLILEVLLLVLRAFTGTAGDSPKPFVSDLAQKVSWSFIVCVGLAFGSAASKARDEVMGLLGAISAPLGFAAARAVHKGVNSALDVAGPAVAAGFPFLIAALKGIEYAVFGFVLSRLGKRTSSLGAYVGAGAAIGLTFGVVIVIALARASKTPLGPVELAARGINEVLFPVGCSLVLYAAEALGKRIPSTTGN